MIPEIPIDWIHKAIFLTAAMNLHYIENRLKERKYGGVAFHSLLLGLQLIIARWG